MTNKETDKAAEKLGFKDTGEKSHGQKVYKKGNEYITQNVDSHNGGIWKWLIQLEIWGQNQQD